MKKFVSCTYRTTLIAKTSFVAEVTFKGINSFPP